MIAAGKATYVGAAFNFLEYTVCLCQPIKWKCSLENLKYYNLVIGSKLHS